MQREKEKEWGGQNEERKREDQKSEIRKSVRRIERKGMQKGGRKKEDVNVARSSGG